MSIHAKHSNATSGRNTTRVLGNLHDHADDHSPLEDSAFRAIFECAPHPMGIVEISEDAIVHLADNAAAGRLFEHTPTWMLNKRAADIGIDPELVHLWMENYRESERTGLPQQFLYPHHTITDSLMLQVTVCYLGVSPAGTPRFSYVVEDVTESRLTETTLQLRVQQYKDLHAAAERHERVLALRDKVRTALMRELDPSAIIHTVVEGIADTFGYTHVSIYLVKGETLDLQHHVGYDNAIAQIPLSQGITGQVASTGEAVLLEDVQSEPTFIAAASDVVSEVCVPLFEDDRVAGILNIESTNGARLTREDLGSIIALSEFVSIALGRARLYAEMKESRERFQAFMNNSPSPAFIKDHNGRYIYINVPFERAFGTTASYLLGKSNTEWLPHEKSMHEQLRQHDMMVLSTGNTIEVTETVPSAEGVSRDYLVYKFPITNAEGQRFVGGVAFDITERNQAEAALHQLAIRDELTGLYNRREMRRLLEEGADRFHTYGHSAALILLDIDHFKSVNDTYGHRAGDRVLQWLTQMLHTRVNRLHSLARYGGEELAIILPDSTDNEALAVADYIRAEIESAPYRLKKGKDRLIEIPITVSLGVAAFSENIGNEEILIAAADMALYDAKRQGRNRAILFDSSAVTSMTFLTSSTLSSGSLRG